MRRQRTPPAVHATVASTLPISDHRKGVPVQAEIDLLNPPTIRGVKYYFARLTGFDDDDVGVISRGEHPF
jgi:hypothetical protein